MGYSDIKIARHEEKTLSDEANRFVVEFERMSPKRLKLIYCCSTVLYWTGTAIVLFGLGLLIPTFVVFPLFALGTVFFVSVGMLMRDIRTEPGRKSLVWWGSCAAVQLLFCLLLLPFEVPEDGWVAVILLLVSLLVLAGPALLVLFCGRKMYGAAALTHKQIKFIHDKRIAETNDTHPQRCPLTRSPRAYDHMVALTVKCGSVLVGVGMIVVNLLALVDGIENSNKHQSAKEGGYRAGSDDQYGWSGNDYNSNDGYSSQNVGWSGDRQSNASSDDRTKAAIALFDCLGDIGQTDEEIREKHQTARKIGNAVGNYVAENFGNGNDYSPEFRQKLGKEMGGLIEGLGRVMMGGPEGAEHMRQIQRDIQECEQKIEQQRMAEQLAAELLNIMGN